jgi:hypothetical protein
MFNNFTQRRAARREKLEDLPLVTLGELCGKIADARDAPPVERTQARGLNIEWAICVEAERPTVAELHDLRSRMLAFLEGSSVVEDM